MLDLVRADYLIETGILSVEDGNHGEYRPRPDEFVESGGTAFIRAADLDNGVIDFAGAGSINLLALSRIRKGIGRPLDVLLSHKGTVGKVALAPRDSPPFVCSPQTTFWRSLDASVLDPRFLYFALKSPVFVAQLEAIKGESDMAPYVSLTQQRLLSIPVPKIAVQRAIADILSPLDDKIAANVKLATAADGLALTLVSRFAPSVALGDVARQSKETANPAALDDQSVTHYSLPAYDAGQKPESVSPSTIKSNKFLVTTPSVLLSKLNPRFPRVWNLAQLSSGVSLASTEFVVLSSDCCSPSLLWSLVAQPRFGAQLEGMVAGTSGSHQRVKPSEILAVAVPDPRDIPVEDGQVIESLALRAMAARVESWSLAVMRDALLPALMSGRLTVYDADAAVESVVDDKAVESETSTSGTLW